LWEVLNTCACVVASLKRGKHCICTSRFIKFWLWVWCLLSAVAALTMYDQLWEVAWRRVFINKVASCYIGLFESKPCLEDLPRTGYGNEALARFEQMCEEHLDRSGIITQHAWCLCDE
jgi:hypothetical protein